MSMVMSGSTTFKAYLPRRYVSQERLCLGDTTDYWVNDGLLGERRHRPSVFRDFESRH